MEPGVIQSQQAPVAVPSPPLSVKWAQLRRPAGDAGGRGGEGTATAALQVWPRLADLQLLLQGFECLLLPLEQRLLLLHERLQASKLAGATVEGRWSRGPGGVTESWKLRS